MRELKEMKWICALAIPLLLLSACGRDEVQSGPDETARVQDAEPEAPEPLSLPGVERLVDLRSGKSPRDYQRAVGEFIRANRDLQVIVGAGWDPAAFAGGAPHKDLLDQVDDFVPIVLFSRDRSTAWVNSEALAAAGIDAGTPNPAGGTIEKDSGGLPIGLVRGTAVALVERIIPRSDGSGELESDNPRHDQPDTE